MRKLFWRAGLTDVQQGWHCEFFLLFDAYGYYYHMLEPIRVRKPPIAIKIFSKNSGAWNSSGNSTISTPKTPNYSRFLLSLFVFEVEEIKYGNVWLIKPY